MSMTTVMICSYSLLKKQGLGLLWPAALFVCLTFESRYSAHHADLTHGYHMSQNCSNMSQLVTSAARTLLWAADTWC